MVPHPLEIYGETLTSVLLFPQNGGIKKSQTEKKSVTHQRNVVSMRENYISHSMLVNKSVHLRNCLAEFARLST